MVYMICVLFMDFHSTEGQKTTDIMWIHVGHKEIHTHKLWSSNIYISKPIYKKILQQNWRDQLIILSEFVYALDQ
jgi:hypothetical protein